MIRKNIAVIAICIMFTGSLLTSCGGGDTTTVDSNSTMNTQTLGQQLIDLDNAYKQGAISEDEYKDLKEALLEKY
jgi:hypothetical protein